MTCGICYGSSFTHCDECFERICCNSSCHIKYETTNNTIFVCSDCIYNIEEKLIPMKDKDIVIKVRKIRAKHVKSLLYELDAILNINKEVINMISE